MKGFIGYRRFRQLYRAEYICSLYSGVCRPCTLKYEEGELAGLSSARQMALLQMQS